MIAADRPVQRSADSRLLYVDAAGRIRSARRSSLIQFLRRGDLVIANDAATLPASLHGVHMGTGQQIEVRLAGRSPSAPHDPQRFIAVVFGAGDYRTRTEDRQQPPALAVGHRLELGLLTAVVVELLDHPRLVALHFEGELSELWRGLAAHGRPIQYAHMNEPLQLWDVWTPIAGLPVAYEPPSAGFAVDWQLLDDFAAAGIEFATLTHAAGISSTGDTELDRRLPFDEAYVIPESTARAIARACHDDRRVVAIGTTVVRALEHSASRFGIVMPGEGVATQRIGATTSLRVVDAILSGTHEPGTSHYDLLHAFAAADVLRRADSELDAGGFRTHEFGDSVLIERDSRKYSRALRSCGTIGKFHEMQGLAGSAAPRILRDFSHGPVHVVQESRRLSPARRLVGQRG